MWLNPRPDSTLMTRVLSFDYVKETKEKNKASVASLLSLNSTLTPTTLTAALEEMNKENDEIEIDNLIDGVQDLAISDHNTIKCAHKVFCTMVDGKVKLHCSNKAKSTRECPICGAGPKQMNESAAEVSKVAEVVDDDILCMGLSPMHGWIKAMEFLINAATRRCIGYKYNAKKSDEEKKKVTAMKLEIQRKLRQELGIIVDCPKQGGSGNSNSGNTARVFFRKKEIVSQLYEDKLIFPIELLERLHTVLLCCSTKEELDPAKLADFCKETHDKIKDLGGWGISPGLHTLLMHSHQVITKLPLPLGFWSEEAQESANKTIKNYLRHHVRTDTEEHSHTDLMMRLLNSSDPEVVLFFNNNDHQHQTPTPEVRSLLKN